MPLLPPSDLFILLEDPSFATPEDILVIGPVPAAAPAPDAVPPAPAQPQDAPAVAIVTAEAETPASAPVFDLPAEDAFPTLAELDAILAAHAGTPDGADAAERAEAAALLGLDPAIAADPDLYAAALAALQDPDGDQVLTQWLSDEVGAPPSEWPEAAGDWQVG
ncbi:hypothetical protein AAFN86_14270 [Roseomonas sp. CAU 1739]|uniref:hypothetical protein n=1 Tax=Roseomonas sp. CAU 1739 TaxID=3140364 RepID=UPI00325B83BD